MRLWTDLSTYTTLLFSNLLFLSPKSSMHRQSLSSPALKHGIVVGAGDENINKMTPEDLQNHWKEKLASSESDDEENQSEKPNQPKSMFISSFRLIHLIPLLTLFCFIILYLASHDPSGKGPICYKSINIVSNLNFLVIRCFTIYMLIFVMILLIQI